VCQRIDLREESEVLRDLVLLNVDHRLDILRGDARFWRISKDVGLLDDRAL
jgi:hypothetical protein